MSNNASKCKMQDQIFCKFIGKNLKKNCHFVCFDATKMGFDFNFGEFLSLSYQFNANVTKVSF